MELLNIYGAVRVASQAFSVDLKPIRGKKVFFDARNLAGERIVLCTPYSKFHSTAGVWWVDLTQIQYDLCEKYDKAIVILRLEGSMLCMFDWQNLKPFLTEDCKKYNEHEKEHWKLYIYKNHIKIAGNEKLFMAQVVGYKS